MASLSSGKGNRIIEVEVKSAKLNNVVKAGSLYVRVSISEGQRVETRLVKLVQQGFPTSWNQKFVFSVPNRFVFDDGYKVSFTVFRARKYLRDVEIGKATGPIRALFPVDQGNNNDNNTSSNNNTIHHDDDEDQTADNDDDDGHHEEEEGEEIQAKETYELKASAGIPIHSPNCSSRSEVIGTLNICIVAWEKYYPDEAKLYGRESKCFAVFVESKKAGSMILQKAKEEDYKRVRFVGDVKWGNLAMESDEFSMERETAGRDLHQKRRSSSLGLCFANPSHFTLA